MCINYTFKILWNLGLTSITAESNSRASAEIFSAISSMVSSISSHILFVTDSSKVYAPYSTYSSFLLLPESLPLPQRASCHCNRKDLFMRLPIPFVENRIVFFFQQSYTIRQKSHLTLEPIVFL